MGKVEFGVALCKAAAENDHNKIRQMIEAGVRAGMADYDYRTALHLAASNGHLETCVFLLREGKVDPNPLDRFLCTPLDDAIRHDQMDVVQLLVKYKGRPSSDEECLGTIRDEFIKTMEEENKRKDSDKLEKELKTHGFAEVLERLTRLRTEIEDETHQFIASATNIRYDLCRILHSSLLMSDDSARGASEMEAFNRVMSDEGGTVSRLKYLMEKDMKSFDSCASKILENVDNELLPWLNSLRSNSHTKGLLPLLMPSIFEDLGDLTSVLRHVKALLPRLMVKLQHGGQGLGLECKAFGLLYCRFLQPRSSDLQDLLFQALQLLVENQKDLQPWPAAPRTQQALEQFRTSNLVASMTCGLQRKPFKPPEQKIRELAEQEEESI